MYKVLYQPAMRVILPHSSRSAFACLMYEGATRAKPLLYSFAHNIDDELQDEVKFELAATMLNRPPCLSVQKERLRSVGQVKQQQLKEAQCPTRVPFAAESFRADFGRMDIGFNPGWGRD